LPFSNVIRVKAEGKEGAMIAELYTVYRTELLKYCCMICGNVSDAEDLLQETFMKALSNLDLLEELGEKERRAWLYSKERVHSLSQMGCFMFWDNGYNIFRHA